MMLSIDRWIGFLWERMVEVNSHFRRVAVELMNRHALNNYLKSDRRPWRFGYGVYRNKYLGDIIYDASKLEIFLKLLPLPPGYGFRLDARMVEIPWALARVAEQTGRLLDAGSSLNHEVVLGAPPLAGKRITIVTLAPESECHWRKGISYVFDDLRNLEFRDGYFDIITCISTIEHVGMDNTMYTEPSDRNQAENTRDFILAIKEMRRVLKPNGVLYITFPFGRYENHIWFQQFDSQLTDTLIGEFAPSRFQETVFRYDADGWKLSDRTSCADCRFFDVHKSKYFDPKSTIEYPPDFPAGERAVICLELNR
jgi:SAM-dependent methyltransferase